MVHAPRPLMAPAQENNLTRRYCYFRLLKPARLHGSRFHSTITSILHVLVGGPWACVRHCLDLDQLFPHPPYCVHSPPGKGAIADTKTGRSFLISLNSRLTSLPFLPKRHTHLSDFEPRKDFLPMARGQNVIPAISKQSVRSSTRRQSKIQAGEDSSEDQMGLDRQKAKPASIKRRLNIRSPTPARGRPLRRPGSPAVNNEESEASEEGGGESGEASDDESESDVKKPSVIAPSGAVRKRRNHQTGLSISFSKSSLSAVDKSKKRARSPTNSGNDNEETRPTKLSKIASNAAALLESSDDDEIYNAVDLISESEDDKDVEKVEEYAIIASEGDFFDLDGAIESSRPSSAISEDAQAQDDETPHFDEHFARTATAHDLDIAVAMDNEQPRKPSWFRQRRVHFADDVFFRETDTSHTVAGDPSGRSELGDAAQKAGIPVGSPAEWAVEAPDDQPGSERECDLCYLVALSNRDVCSGVG